VEARVPIDPITYAFPCRLAAAHHGQRPRRRPSTVGFASYPTHGTVVDTVSLGGARPSALVPPVDPGLVPPDAQPACPSLRGDPCRHYVPAGNGG
jgi:hypothetical protein